MPQATPPSNLSVPQPDESQTDNISIARQAIVDDKGRVFGYELFDRTRRFSEHDASSDAQMLFNVLSQADTATLMGKRTMFVNCAHESLDSEHLHLVKPERIVLEVPPVKGNDPAVIAAAVQALTDAHAYGFKLAFNNTVLTPAYEQWLPLASYIKIDLLTLKADLVEHVIRLAQKKKPETPIIVEKVETAEQHKLAAALGVRLFQGYWFSKPVVESTHTIRPAHAVIIQLLNVVRKQAPTEEIEEVLKRDATLSFNLLRYINSSGFGLSTEITSFRHAVMILGLKKLFRWAALLLTMSREGGVPPAVGQMAIVRGRLMELLAAELLPPDECDNAFVTGVFSLLDTMLGIPMEKAIHAVTLPETITNALLHNQGQMAPFLALTIACETADDASFARLADELTLSNHQINWAHLQALNWAETLGE
jgi:EAL and modified HD-GYP domain-containing signal transduction protein